MKYNFDEVIDRTNTNAMKISGFRDYLFPGAENVDFGCSDEELIKMWIADMEFATPDIVIEKMKERLERRIFGYTKIFDDDYYRVFNEWTTNKYGWSVKKEQLVSSPGIIPALYELVGLITKPDEKVLIATPSYAYFKYAADHNKRETVCSSLVEVSPGEFKFDFADLAQKAKDPKVTLFILCNPHNPNGIIWTEDELKEIAKIAKENDLWVISDEIHCDLIRVGKKHLPFAKVAPDNDKVITCMAPTKTFNLAGMMISHVIVPNKKLKEEWAAFHYLNENPISLAAAQAAYEFGDDWLQELKAYIDANFEYLDKFLKERLPKAIFKIPDATYLAWVNLAAYFAGDDFDLAMFFAKNGVLLEAGNQFVKDGEGFIRLNLACPRAMLVNALEKIEKTINNK